VVAPASANYRCHLDYVPAIRHSCFERRVIEVAATSSLDRGDEALVDAPIESH
jgi:hypothetical protein